MDCSRLFLSASACAPVLKRHPLAVTPVEKPVSAGCALMALIAHRLSAVCYIGYR